MKAEIIKAKDLLINLMCKEAVRIMKGKICKVGWVDYLHGKNMTQYAFTSAYEAVNGDVIMVEKDGGESSINLRMHEINDIEKLEWILKGLKENN